jgi:hypothetical protein
MLPANTTPAEALEISPEALEVANCYLQTQDINEVADQLDIPKDQVVSLLARREVKAYVDQVFMNLGFNNRFKIRAAMDALISQKFQELDESGMGTTKDIADLLEQSHRMTMAELDRQIQLEKLRQSSIKTQTNIQINDGGGSNYSSLIERLLGVSKGT